MKGSLHAKSSEYVEYGYDDLGRLQHKWLPMDGTTTASLTYEYYTGSGMLKSITTDKGTCLSYKYDERNRLQKVFTDAAQNALAASYKYDPMGNLKSVLYANQVQSTFTYNTRNQLQRVLGENVAGNTPVTCGSFDYDDADSTDGLAWPSERRMTIMGQHRGVREVLPAAGAGYPRLVGYTYDHNRRLTTEGLYGTAVINAVTTWSPAPAGSVGYGTYDPVGNRPSRTASNFNGVGNQTALHYDLNDRLDNDTLASTASTDFDVNGNTIKGDILGSAAPAVGDEYDVENRLIKATRSGQEISLTYDGEGQRVKKEIKPSGSSTVTSTTYYLVDDQNPTGYAQVLEERSAPSASPTVTYLYGSSLISQNRGGTIHYYGYDGQGSVRYLTGGNSTDTGNYGNVTDTYTYDAFGIQTASTGTTENNYRYTGQQWDSDLGLYYLRARYYNPQTGRFWTMDTFEGNQEDPLSLHKYLYCQANPVNGVDPTGNDMIEMSISMSLGNSLHSMYDSGVTTVGNSLQNTIIGVYSGASVAQIVTMSFLENAGGTILGGVIGKVAQLRKLPGIVKGAGKMIQGGRWLRGSEGNAAYIPEQIAAKLAGRKFPNFDEFRAAFWKLVGEDVELAKAFNAGNVARMKAGNAPFVAASQRLGGRVTYEFHHITPIQHGGSVYDIDNLIICTPRFQKEVLEPAYHY